MNVDEWERDPYKTGHACGEACSSRSTHAGGEGGEGGTDDARPALPGAFTLGPETPLPGVGGSGAAGGTGPGGTGGPVSDGLVEDLKEEFWDDMGGVLRELPLELGACVRWEAC